MPCKDAVREEIDRDECVVHEDAIFICFWHHKSEAVQWLESGDAGLAQLEEQQKVFALQGLELHESIWAMTELSGASYFVEFRSFGPTGEAAVEAPDVVALALADKTIMRRYVYAVCRRRSKMTAEEAQRCLAKVAGDEPAKQLSPANCTTGLACAHCGNRKLPSASVVDPGEGYPDSLVVNLCVAVVCSCCELAPAIDSCSCAFHHGSTLSGSTNTCADEAPH
eukprot:TRINITY_DN29412_c0_g1_i1.p1 TRINITY_DN29412_c0_g1~~TRINITY_DN29412_c0_g1_i1.p1  ORF type:complete len:224 (+),score=27.52 TRINITY_DN29412_c0_g1_i1:46-717(+)